MLKKSKKKGGSVDFFSFKNGNPPFHTFEEHLNYYLDIGSPGKIIKYEDTFGKLGGERGEIHEWVIVKTKKGKKLKKKGKDGSEETYYPFSNFTNNNTTNDNMNMNENNPQNPDPSQDGTLPFDFQDSQYSSQSQNTIPLGSQQGGNKKFRKKKASLKKKSKVKPRKRYEK